ncbi:MAG TPA: fibronectin type III domain-containing protein [Candidatus Dojkabacteria bacterium]|nr:fibronectin type III domain-containing protein [Candidatus Dojkabacteria bacterium]
MYVTPKQKQRYLITTLIIAIAIPITAFAAYLVTQILSNAGGSIDPQGVVMSNVTSNSLTLTWTTDTATTGSIVVSTGGKSSAPYTDVRGSSKRKTHYIEVTSLEPSKDYTFYITSNTTKYTSVNGQSFKFKTPPITTNTPIPNPVYGSISGSKSDDILVYVVTGTETDYPASATPNKSGNWIIDLSSIRNGTSELVSVTSTSDLKILVRGSDGTGAIIKGKYNELFDKDGKLFDSNSLALNPAADIISNFNTKSVISSVIAQQITCKCSDGTDLGLKTSADCQVAKASQCSSTPSNVSCICPNGTNLGSMTQSACTTAKLTQCTSTPTTVSCICPDGTNLGSMTQSACTTAKKTQCTTSNNGSRVFRYVLDVKWKAIAGTNVGGSTSSPDLPTGQSSVITTNLTDTAFNVVWLTKTGEQGYVKYGKSVDDITSIAYDDRDDLTTKGNYQAHSVKVSQLLPDTTYYYQIYSGQTVIQNNGQPYSLKTFKTLSSPPQFKTVSGKITGVSNSKDAVIYASIKDSDSVGSAGTSTVTSSIPDENGNWIVTIGDMRTSDGSDYFNYSSGDKITFKALVYADILSSTQTMSTVDSATITLSPSTSQTTRQIIKVDPLTVSGLH